MTPGLVLVLVAGCGHSEPFVTTDRDPFGPFSVAEPIRLTYADGNNIHPAISQGGDRLVYAFSENSPDHDADVCLGVLPAGGGARLATVCPRVADDGAFRDGIEHAALSADGVLAFVQHSGHTPPTNFTSLRGGLYLATFDSVADAHQILQLKQPPPGGAEPWNYLVDLRWTAPHELLALAVRSEYRGPNLQRDTLHFGIDVVRLRTDRSPVEWTRVTPGLDASVMTLDESAGMVYLLVHSYQDDLAAVAIADTVFRVPLAGGQPELVVGLPRDGGPPNERLIDIAASSGRLLATRTWAAGGEPQSDLVELTGPGQISPIPADVPGQWGRLAISPDGRTVIAESMGNGITLYRVALP